MAGRLEQEFDQVEIAALESWLSQRSIGSVPGRESERGMERKSWTKGMLERRQAERDAENLKKEMAEKFAKLHRRSREGLYSETVVKDIKAGLKILRESRVGQIGAPVAKSAASSLGLMNIPGAGLLSALGKAAGPAIGIASLITLITGGIAESIERTSGTLGAIEQSRGKGHPALRSPFLRTGAPGYRSALSALTNPNMEDVIFGANFFQTWGEATWEFWKANTRGQSWGIGGPSGMHGTAFNRAAQVYYGNFKEEPPHIRRVNNLERYRYDQQLDRGETEFLGWRKTPNRFGG